MDKEQEEFYWLIGTIVLMLLMFLYAVLFTGGN